MAIILPIFKVRPGRNYYFKNYPTNPISESLFLRPSDNNEDLKETS